MAMDDWHVTSQISLYLMKKGYPAIVLRKEYRGLYYRFLSLTEIGNLVLFVSYIAKSADKSLTSYLAMSGGIDELVPLVDLANLEETPY